MITEVKLNKEQNLYAKTIKGKEIFIHEAESGQNGYYCIGCDAEMQAVRSKIPGRKQFFRHVALDKSQPERKCTFSNETYRHKQAALILSRIKKVKVPAVYKYSIDKNSSHVMVLQKPTFIEAEHAQIELSFYENDNGEVKWGKNSIDEKSLLIRPDVTFFNNKNEPILLIEIVVTHKINAEKKAKINRLGINTLQISVPKDSLENIERSMAVVDGKKWVYHYEEQRTNYVSVPKGNPKELSQIDELQRRLFEESYECRSSEIGNLIRAIGKCLASEPHRTIEGEIRSELSRVKGNTERAKLELEELRERIQGKVDQELGERAEFLEKERERVSSIEKGIVNDHESARESIERKSKDLEGRYLTKRDELAKKQREIEEKEERIRNIGLERDRLERETKRIEENIISTEERIRKDNEYREGLSKRFEILRNKESEKIESAIEDIRKRKGAFPETFEREEKAIEEEFGFEEKGIREQFEKFRKGSSSKTKRGDSDEFSRLSERMERILAIGRLINDLKEDENKYNFYRTARECLKTGTYKKWT